jgi:hypothetical protein
MPRKCALSLPLYLSLSLSVCLTGALRNLRRLMNCNSCGFIRCYVRMRIVYRFAEGTARTERIE